MEVTQGFDPIPLGLSCSDRGKRAEEGEGSRKEGSEREGRRANLLHGGSPVLSLVCSREDCQWCSGEASFLLR